MKVVTFGEIMLRLTPPHYARLVQARSFEGVYGGAEANVAIGLANLGAQTAFVSKVPENAVGQAAVNSLRAYGVDTSNVVRGGERLGVYFMERGASQRASEIIYDRSHTAFSEAQAKEFDWNNILKDADWLHCTGITPALSASAAQICEDALSAAKHLGLTVSFDVNYRAKLWDVAEARGTLSRLLSYADVCITNEGQAEALFDLPSGNAEAAAKELAERFGLKYVAFTFRKTLEAERNLFSAALYGGTQFFRSSEYDIRMVDRIGGGDAFAAGLIYAVGNGYGAERAVRFAAAASCLKHTIEGDANIATAEEVERILDGKTGSVQR